MTNPRVAASALVRTAERIRNPLPAGRTTARGKFLYAGGRKLFVRGATYGTFRPGPDGLELPPPETVLRDLQAMAAHGLDTVRTYTVPPAWMLDLAASVGLRVLVGIPAERYVGQLNNGRRAEAERTVRGALHALSGHPAVLAFSIGNELPASLVRWHGRARVERDLERLVRMAKAEDPDALLTYVNYPTTEYLDLPFLDVVAFNVYLEDVERLRAYLGRLQNVAGDRPLLMAELGLDSRRHGEPLQSRTLAAQIRASFDAGCAGAFVYSWTDEWHRGGRDVLDWDFGLVRRDRSPKRALAAVSAAYDATPFPVRGAWPRVSVLVCTYNGARTLTECLESLRHLEYPDYEVIVVDDGSTDATPEIARASGFRLVQEGRQGLSGARNAGMRAATGEILAYIDDDAAADPHWLSYLVTTFRQTRHVAVGGPNLPPPGDGAIAAAVSNSPGNPVHVLLTDDEAEHIPGCNFAVRRDALLAIGGFDPRFDRAGDDVDVCWRLRDRGWTLGYSPAAVVWHHRRGSVRAFWRQQFHYGAAEAQLETKFPERYNSVGHHTWAGRVYGARILPLVKGAVRVYHGVWGQAPFQSMYQPSAGALAFLPLMPEWALLMGGLALVSLLGVLWAPLLLALPLLALGLLASVVQAARGGVRARFGDDVPRAQRPALRVLTALLHLMQPCARLAGRMCRGLTPWRQRLSGFAWPRVRTEAIWAGEWRDVEAWLGSVEAALRRRGLPVRRGGDWDRWDLSVRCGALGGARLLFGAEDHAGGCQLVRFRIWPSCSHKGFVLLVTAGSLAAVALPAQAWPLALLAASASACVALRVLLECGSALAALRDAVGALRRGLGAQATVGDEHGGAAP